MSVYSNISYDHEKVSKLVFDIEALERKNSQLRMPLFKKLKKEILILHRAEEKTIYSELHEYKKTKPLVEDLYEENERIERLLKNLTNLPDNSEKWHENFSKLKTLLLSHIAKEEKELFPKAGQVLDTNDEIEIEQHLLQNKKQQWHIGVDVAPISPTDDFAKKVRAS